MNDSKLIIASLAFATLLMFQGVSNAQNSESPTGDIPAKLRGLPERWSEAMKDLHVAGLAVVVVRGDALIYEGNFGVRDTAKNLPVTSSTVFYIASCTKTYLATAVMMLAEQGRIDLDAPVKKYLPQFRLADEQPTHAVTVRDLLSHAKGLDSTPIVFLDAFSGEITDQRYYRWLREVNTGDEPKYTNVHYTLLGRVVDAVTGESWKDFLQDSIFTPAGMVDTTAYASKMYAADDVAIPTMFAGGQWVPATARKTDRTMHAAGGMGTSTRDLSRWLQIHLNGGKIGESQILSSGHVDEMQQIQAAGRGGAPGIPNVKMKGFGLSWFIATYKNRPMLHHGGGYVGTSAIIAMMPDEKLGVAVVSNSTGVLPQLVAFDVFDRMLDLEGDNLLPMVQRMTNQFYARTKKWSDKLGKNPAPDGLSLKASAYRGEYKNDQWGTISISGEESDDLVLRIGDLAYEIGSQGLDKIALIREINPPDAGHFETGSGRVTALIIKFSDYADEIRFEKQ